MNNEKIIQSVQSMRKEIFFTGVIPIRADPKKENKEIEYILSHILWMLIEIEVLVKDSRKEKAFRWLGFVQGVLWSLELKNITDIKNLNKP